MGALILCDFGLNIATTWVRNILGVKAQNRMQQRMLDRILRSEWHGRERYHSGDVLNRLEFDVSNVVSFSPRPSRRRSLWWPCLWEPSATCCRWMPYWP